MGKPAKHTAAPIIDGDMIAGTNLRRRFQGELEICPRYVGPESGQGERLDAARRHCAQVGVRMYIDDRDTYWQIDGTWCLAFVGSEMQIGKAVRGG